MDSSLGQQEFNYLFELLMIGNSSVGKNNLLPSFISDDFQDLSPTIGVDFEIKYVTIDGKQLKLAHFFVTLMIFIWDTACQEKFRTLTSTYYRGTQGIIMGQQIVNDSMKRLTEGRM
ncbi:ras-related protein RABC1-like [Arachis stenosperma]|uniref:ras-related protein RABC1-like n=1 Tax=Arachis stenosperma TaxID=217475 RepID=UPI0025ACEF41|nr:ras-related protein RABC1-like [Arachis stenosperma]